MKQIASAFRRTKFGAVAALFLFAAVAVALPARQASASGLQYRNLQLSSTASSSLAPVGSGGDVALEGTAANGQKVTHTYIFSATTDTSDILGMTIEYCDDAFGYVAACGAVDGFNATLAPNAQVSLSTGGTLAGNDLVWGSATTFTTANADADSLEITHATGVNPGNTIAAGKYVRVVFTATASNYFVNPNDSYLNAVSSPNASRSFFAHITTFSDDDLGGGDVVDEGTVTSSTANLVTINTRVQETLKFSVGGYGGSADIVQGAANAPGTACDALDTGAVGASMIEGQLTMGDNNQSLGAATIYKTKSYARLATNSARGAKVLYAGQTLKSTAGDSIAAIGATAATAAFGAEQFGLAVLDTATITNADYTALAPQPNYDDATTGEYAFDILSNTAPVVLAQSTGVVGCDTLPIEFVGNISNETPAGLYSTKVSYIAVPAY